MYMYYSIYSSNCEIYTHNILYLKICTDCIQIETNKREL